MNQGEAGALCNLRAFSLLNDSNCVQSSENTRLESTYMNEWNVIGKKPKPCRS